MESNDVQKMIEQHPVAKEAYDSLTDLLYSQFEEGFEDLDVLIESTVHRLLREGPEAFGAITDPFPSNTIEKVKKNEAYKKYSETYLKQKKEIPVEAAKKDEEPKKIVPQREKPIFRAAPEDVDNTLEGAFVRVKQEQNLEYDENFVLLFEVRGKKQFKKEELISNILEHYKNDSFTAVFNAFRPFLFDLLKRREGFEDFIQYLRKINDQVKPKCHAVIKTFEVRDLIALLIESCSPKSMAKLGSWLVNQFYPLPIVSKIDRNRFQINLNCCSEVMFQTQRSLITSIGTKNSKGKSSILSYLFSIKASAFFSTQNGLTHSGSIDLYTKLPQEGFEHIVADINGFVDDKIFQTISSTVLTFSQLVLIHITEKDVTEKDEDIILSSDVNAIINKAKKFVLLFRDYDEDEQEDLIANIEESLKSKFPNYIKTIPVPKFTGPENLDTQNQKHEVMQSVLEALEKLVNSAISPLMELKNAYELENPQGPNDGYIKIDLAKESSLTTKLLKDKFNEIKEKSLYETFFPCVWLDARLSEEFKEKVKIDKDRGDLSINQIEFLRQRYEENEKNIKKYQDKKKEVVASDLIKHIISIVSSNDLLRILLLSETINNWKMPLYEPTKRKYLELCTQKQTTNNDNKEINEKIKKLELEMDDRDVTLDTFLDEITSLYETNKMGTDVKGIQDYIRSTLQQGAPINLVNGKTLKFGSQVLEDLFEKYEKENTKVYVISIIGAQSSAKSTLLNVLFGCGFVTSAGRCTKGLYISLLELKNEGSDSKCHLVIIDTEGLLSVVARDHEFDNLITTMAFSCSHLVIINNKGEINTKLKDLLEVCVFAMKHLKLSNVKPKIIFALRDIADDSSQVQKEMLIQMKNSLEESAKRLFININSLIDISEEDVFLLPSAFQLSLAPNETRIISNNKLFSQKILDMRTYILDYLRSTSSDTTSIENLKWFYKRTKQLWGDINEHGKDIIRAKNFLEIELKNEAMEEVNKIYNRKNQDLLQRGRAVLDLIKQQMETRKSNMTEDFIQMLTKEFNTVKDEAFLLLENTVLNNEKYAVISGFHREFKETLEYCLGWQKQNFLSEWKAYIISYETYKELDNFKASVKAKVNDILQNKTSESIKTFNITNLFEDLKKKVQEDHKSKLIKLHTDIKHKLIQEIQGHFEAAQHKRSSKGKHFVTIPALGIFTKRIDQINYPVILGDKWLKIGLYKTIKNVFDVEFLQRELEKIVREFVSLQKELDSVIEKVSSEESASKIIEVCFNRIARMEENQMPVNFATFIHSCLLEAMFAQYTKTQNAEAERINTLQIEIKETLQKEEIDIRELLSKTKDVFELGARQAKKCYEEILKAFCETQQLQLQNTVMEKIRNEFPTPKSANEKAFKNSFEISNYINVVKYVLNINQFIRELYDEKIQEIAKIEIEKNINHMNNQFVAVIGHVMEMTNKWALEYGGKENVDLSTLYVCALEDQNIKPYFPELYILKIPNVESFKMGFLKELAKQLKEYDTVKTIKENVTKKVNAFLNNQYTELVGCQARCPICHNKCTWPDPNHSNHHTNCHFLTGFAGVHNRNTNEVHLQVCFDPLNYKTGWYLGDEFFKTFDDLIGQKYPDWRAEFPTKDQPEKHLKEISPKLIECWVACKEVFLQYYGYLDKTPPEWESQVPIEKRLKRNHEVKGYTNKGQ